MSASFILPLHGYLDTESEPLCSFFAERVRSICEI
jgi:hypothetical protein